MHCHPERGTSRRIRTSRVTTLESRILRLRSQARSAQDDNALHREPATYGTLYLAFFADIRVPAPPTNHPAQARVGPGDAVAERTTLQLSRETMSYWCGDGRYRNSYFVSG